jgi:hypothetical protein
MILAQLQLLKALVRRVRIPSIVVIFENVAILHQPKAVNNRRLQSLRGYPSIAAVSLQHRELTQ